MNGHQIFIEMMNAAITSKILKGQLNTVLEKNVTKLFQNRKLIEQLVGSGFKNVPPFARGGMGAVYNFGGYVIKETKICQNIQTQVFQELCDIANKNDDIQYETVDTALNKKKYILPNHILELLCGIYLSQKLRSFTDGFGYCMSGLYDKTRKATYILQERLTSIQDIIPNGFNGLSLVDYLILLYEILMTLAISQDKYKFVHYDLHTGNIMFRDCGVVKKRIYDCIVTDEAQARSGRTSIIVDSRYQPVIIDYGFARFETDDVIVSPVVELKDNTGNSYLDNHLYNPYYDLVTLLRSFMMYFRKIINNAPESTPYMIASATDLYNITICILSYTFGDMAHDLIETMFPAPQNPRVLIDKLCKMQVRGIKDIASRILNMIQRTTTNAVAGTDGVPPIPAVPLQIGSNMPNGYTIAHAAGGYSAQNISGQDRYYDVRNLDLFRDFKVINAPLNLRIGGITAGFAWQYENYRISRTLLGLTNTRKNYNLTLNEPQYNDDLHISCAVMWNPSTRTTPFRFSTECCRIDAKRFLQDERIREGITINGAFFQWKKNFGPFGFFKKDQLSIDDSDINFNYASDYYYILINENGNLSIAPTNVLEDQPYNIFDESNNTSIFTSGPKLVGGGVSLFTDNKRFEVYSDNGVYYLKYLSRQGGHQSFRQTYNDNEPQFVAANVYEQAPPIPENVFIKDISDIRPGDFIHALNPNPRSVIATTNNGLVLFFTFLGRNNFAGDLANANGGATGIDLIDLSTILVNPALIAPLNLPDGTQITDAINLDGGASSSVNIKDAAQPNIITSGQQSASYMVGNIVAYTYK